MEKALTGIALCLLIYDLFIKPFRYALAAQILPVFIILVFRTIQYRHFPVLGLFETLNFYAFSLMTLNLLLSGRCNRRTIRYSQFACLILLSAAAFAKTSVSPFLPDSLNTVLFPLHVAFSFVSYALFTLSFIGALTEDSAETILDLNYFGFVAFTIGLWTGGIWAYKAWGAYFLFSIKEIFSFVIWMYYAALVHVRYFKERGPVLKLATIIGFAIVLFTYIGVGVFMRNTHSLG